MRRSALISFRGRWDVQILFEALCVRIARVCVDPALKQKLELTNVECNTEYHMLTSH